MNGIIIINKPSGITSRDVVNKLSKKLNTKKIGHTGTLDPIATGVLVITVGNCTKLCDLLTSEYKEYIACMKLGIKTDTGDITGTIIDNQTVKVFEKEDIINKLNSFIGFQTQTVPIYSAVKVNGKKLYEYARNNIQVDLPTRDINIKEIELLEYNNDEIRFRVIVSKGTYIRALIEDIATSLGTIATMKELNRTKQGKFNITEAQNLDDEIKIIPKEEILDLEAIDIDESLYDKVKDGQIIDKIGNNDLISLKYNNRIIAIYKTYLKDKNKIKPYIMFIKD